MWSLAMTCLFNTGPWGLTIVELCNFIVSANSGSLHMNHNISRRVCINMVHYSRSFVISGNPGDLPKKVVSTEEKARLWCKRDWPVLRVAYHRMFLSTTGFLRVAYHRMFLSTTGFVFQLFGHNKVSVLNGGFQKWLADEFEVTTEEPKVEVSENVHRCFMCFPFWNGP